MKRVWTRVAVGQNGEIMHHLSTGLSAKLSSSSVEKKGVLLNAAAQEDLLTGSINFKNAVL